MTERNGSGIEAVHASDGHDPVHSLLRQQATLAQFGHFALRESDVRKILTEGCRLSAEGTDVPYAKVLEHRAEEATLVIVAGTGWKTDVVGRKARADASNPGGLAFVTRAPAPIEDVFERFNADDLPSIYHEHDIGSSVNVLIATEGAAPYGVLEVTTSERRRFGETEINFLTAFANVLADALERARKNEALRRTYAEKDALARQQAVLLRELQHRVRNNLQSIYAVTARYARQAASDQTAARGYEDVGRRVMTLATLYDHLLGVDMAERIDFCAYLKTLVGKIAEFGELETRDVDLGFHGESVEMNLNACTALGIAVNELVANALEHAFPPGRRGRIRVLLQRGDSDRTAMLTIDDNGTGIGEGGTTGRGLTLVLRVVEEVGGTLERLSQAGTTWFITFPVLRTP